VRVPFFQNLAGEAYYRHFLLGGKTDPVQAFGASCNRGDGFGLTLVPPSGTNPHCHVKRSMWLYLVLGAGLTCERGDPER